METSPIPALDRVPTGIEGLDQILKGGLLRGGIYLVTGPPGAGKTIMSNQIAFTLAARGERSVYVTLLAEMHTRMLAHLSTLDFFDLQRIPDLLYYISGYPALEDGGLTGLRSQIRQVIRDQGSRLLVLDGLETLKLMAESELAIKRFLLQLQLLMETTRCTALLLDQPAASSRDLLHTMSEGWIDLRERSAGPRTVRELEVRKLRGTSFIGGWHQYVLSKAGMRVYPRTEALVASLPAPRLGEPLSTGVPGLDEFLLGGVRAGSATMVVGSPGCGKSLLALPFLAEATSGLWLGFFGSTEILASRARAIGIDLEAAIAAGRLELLWRTPQEDSPDGLAELLLDAVTRRGVDRLVLESATAFQLAMIEPERWPGFLAALLQRLRAAGVTTFLLLDDPALLPPAESAFAETVIQLRAGRAGRTLSLLRHWHPAHPFRECPLRFTDQGIVIDCDES